MQITKHLFLGFAFATVFSGATVVHADDIALEEEGAGVENCVARDEVATTSQQSLKRVQDGIQTKWKALLTDGEKAKISENFERVINGAGQAGAENSRCFHSRSELAQALEQAEELMHANEQKVVDQFGRAIGLVQGFCQRMIKVAHQAPEDKCMARLPMECNHPTEKQWLSLRANYREFAMRPDADAMFAQIAKAPEEGLFPLFDDVEKPGDQYQPIVVDQKGLSACYKAQRKASDEAAGKESGSK